MGVYFAIWSWIAGLVRPRALARRKQDGENVQVQLRSFRTARAFHSGNALPNESPEARSPWLSSLHNLWLALILAAAWTALEWVRGWMFSGWGWNGLGVALHKILTRHPDRGVHRGGRAYLSSSPLPMSSRSRPCAVSSSRPKCASGGRISILPSRWRRSSVSAAYGIRALQIESATEPLRVAAVQANVPREEKFSRGIPGENLRSNSTRLTQVALATRPPPQLIIWPESSTPAPVLLDEENYRFVMDLSASIKTDLLLGTIDADEKGDYNAAILVSERRREHPGLSQAASRALRRICARAEHRALHRHVIVGDQVPADFTRGKEPVVFRLTTDRGDGRAADLF